MVVRVAVGVGLALLVAWLALAVYLLTHRPGEGSAGEALRILPDTIGLLRRVAMDRMLPRGVRLRLWLILAYLLFPIDLVPDFLPVIGYLDDVVIAGVALRSVIRRAGPEALRRHWRGTDDGLVALWRVAGLPGTPPAPQGRPVP